VSSAFSRYTISNRRFVYLVLGALGLTFVVTSLGALQRIFDTVSLTSTQWGVCLLAPIAFLAIAELAKSIARHTAKHDEGALEPPVRAIAPAPAGSDTAG